MNRRKFALSWGRKVFFGIGWPVLSLVALNYFQSQIIPSSVLAVIYFLLTFFGHYGLLTCVLYFAFYVPMILIFPSYYFSRLWALTLIILGGLYLWLDSTVFFLYRFHINKFFLGLITDGAAKEMIGLPVSLFIIASCVFFGLMVYIWYRGERVWRKMQRRFSNPNKNWYLILILVCVSLSHMFHIYGDAFGNRKITRYAQLFPLYFPSTAKGLLGRAGLLPEKITIQEDVKRDFLYPVEKMNCPTPNNRNMLFIVVNSWGQNELNDVNSPNLAHYAGHGALFKNHHSGSSTMEGGLFSLFYSLPELYWNSANTDQVGPVFIDELIKRNYKMGVFSGPKLNRIELGRTVFLKVPEVYSSVPDVSVSWNEWLTKHVENGDKKPFFGLVVVNSQEETDLRVREVLEGLHVKGQLKDTIIVITGSHGRIEGQFNPTHVTVPFVLISPEMKQQVYEGFTSHYDIIPTLMRNEWGCTNEYSKYSDGKSLFEVRNKQWHVVSNLNVYRIIDYVRNLIVTVNPSKGYEVTDFNSKKLDKRKARENLILDVLKGQSRFRKKLKL